MVRGCDHRHQPRCEPRLPVPARLALKQDVLDVVLDHTVGFIRLAEESTASHLVLSVGDLVPDDRREVVEADRPATLLDAGVQREDKVASEGLLDTLTSPTTTTIRPPGTRAS